MKRISATVLFLLLFFPVLLIAQPTTWQALASRIPGGLDARRIAHLEQEWQVEETEPNLLKMTHKETGMVKYVDITDHEMDFSKLSPNVQVIDLINADTTLHNWKYIRQQNMLLVGGGIGYPMVIGDFNNNQKIDFAGAYKIPINAEIAQAAIAELQPDSTFVLKKVYPDTVITPYAATDVNNNQLLELNIYNPLFDVPGQGFTNYEQSHPDSFPNVRRFTHRTWEVSGEVSRPVFTDLDQDGFTDVLYKGDDSLQPNNHQIFVAEYKPSSGTMERVFGYVPSPDWRTSRFSVGDFDADGFLEFTTGSVTGQVYLVENTGDDSYQPTFHDTVSTPNAYLTAPANDIDGNGKIEFFLGGSSFYNGVPATRIYWFEANGDNNYVKKRSFFLLGTDVLGFDVLSVYDINSDGIDDLVFSFSFSVVMLTWNNATQQFDLFYYDEWENLNQEIHSINMYDVFNSGYRDLFVSVADIANTPRIKSFYYKVNHVTGIEIPFYVSEDFRLAQNFPNPFNGSTTIRFSLPTQSRISLTIYDITGKEVIRLINDRMYALGEHVIKWNGLNKFGKEVSSGLYFYVLQAGEQREVRKMLLIK
jgi:hypothetical protein